MPCLLGAAEVAFRRHNHPFHMNLTRKENPEQCQMSRGYGTF